MRIIIIVFVAMLTTTAMAQNWDVIRNSGNYYYGEGSGETEEEAGKSALENLLQMVAVHVSSDFEGIYAGTNTNGTLSHEESVRQCVRTYAQSSLTGVETWKVSDAPKSIVRKWILRTELERMYEYRKQRIESMMKMADKSLERGMVDMALQHYYWAYSLVRSLQHPTQMVDSEGRILMDYLNVKLRGILKEIEVKVAKVDGDYVDLLFTYQGKPVSVYFTYNDGRSDGIEGHATDGMGSIEMAPGYAKTGIYHIDIEFEYKDLARGDAEMQSVLDVVGKANLGGNLTVKSPTEVSAQEKKQVEAKVKEAGIHLSPSKTQKPEDSTDINASLDKVINAIKARNYGAVSNLFTEEGLDVYQKLINRGTARIIGIPNIVLYKGLKGQTVARGMQMSFSFAGGKKKTFVEDVIFTFTPEGKICNVSFGLGQVAENDILGKENQWSNETREMIISFMENYKTAFALKRLDYIRSIFDDNATIIVGNVAKKTTRPGIPENEMSITGQEIIRYKQYTKSQYIQNLGRTFAQNEFINIQFTNNDVQWLENEEGEKFSIQIGQEYCSSRYADKGYLFLLVDMTNHDEPLIKIRTWQPKPDPKLGLYGPGHFYK